jgi:hypothetical protein
MMRRLGKALALAPFLASGAPLPDSLAASGTLVVCFPSRSGLVVAADSRTTVMGQFVDGVEKLEVFMGSRPILFTVTGNGNFIELPSPRIPLDDWIKNGPYKFRMSSVVEAYLRGHSAIELPAADLSDLAENMASALAAGVPELVPRFIGEEVCRLWMFQADARNRAYYIASIVIVVRSDGRTAATMNPIKRLTLDSPKALELMGESEYAMANVVNARRLSDDSAAIWNRAARVGDITLKDAAYFARNVIEATAKATERIPAPSGIGGPVQMYVVGLRSVRRLTDGAGRTDPVTIDALGQIRHREVVGPLRLVFHLLRH